MRFQGACSYTPKKLSETLLETNIDGATFQRGINIHMALLKYKYKLKRCKPSGLGGTAGRSELEIMPPHRLTV